MPHPNVALKIVVLKALASATPTKDLPKLYPSLKRLNDDMSARAKAVRS